MTYISRLLTFFVIWVYWVGHLAFLYFLSWIHSSLAFRYYLQWLIFYWLNTIWVKICNSKFRIQDSQLKIKKKSMKILFKKKQLILENQSMYPIIKLLFCTKLVLSSAGAFHKNSLIVPCCSFGRFKIQTLTLNRFKNQTNDKSKLLAHNCNHLQEFVKQ